MDRHLASEATLSPAVVVDLVALVERLTRELPAWVPPCEIARTVAATSFQVVDDGSHDDVVVVTEALARVRLAALTPPARAQLPTAV